MVSLVLCHSKASSTTAEEEKKNIEDQQQHDSTYRIERRKALEKERETFIREKERVIAERTLIIKNLDSHIAELNVEIRKFGGFDDYQQSNQSKQQPLKIGGFHTVHKKRGRPKKEDTISKQQHIKKTVQHKNNFTKVYNDGTPQKSRKRVRPTKDETSWPSNNEYKTQRPPPPPPQQQQNNNHFTNVYEKLIPPKRRRGRPRKQTIPPKNSQPRPRKLIPFANIAAIGKAIAADLSQMESSQQQIPQIQQPIHVHVRDVLNDIVSSIANPETAHYRRPFQILASATKSMQQYPTIVNQTWPQPKNNITGNGFYTNGHVPPLPFGNPFFVPPNGLAAFSPFMPPQNPINTTTPTNMKFIHPPQKPPQTAKPFPPANASLNISQPMKKTRGRPRKNPVDKPKRKVGRPRKKSIDIENRAPEKSSEPPSNVTNDDIDHSKSPAIKEEKKSKNTVKDPSPTVEDTTKRTVGPPMEKPIYIDNRTPEKSSESPSNVTIGDIDHSKSPAIKDKKTSKTAIKDQSPVVEDTPKRKRGRPRKKPIDIDNRTPEKLSEPPANVTNGDIDHSKSPEIKEQKSKITPKKTPSETQNPRTNGKGTRKEKSTVEDTPKRKRGRPRKKLSDDREDTPKKTLGQPRGRSLETEEGTPRKGKGKSRAKLNSMMILQDELF